MGNTATLYVLVFPNGKAYVGMTTRNTVVRLSQHCTSAKRGSQFAVHAAIRKHGAPRLVPIMRDSLETIAKYEAELIREMGTVAPNGYNLDQGGRVRNMTDDERRRRREAWARPGFREQVGKKIGAALQGRPKSAAARAAMSLAAKQRQATMSPEQRTSAAAAGRAAALKRWRK